MQNISDMFRRFLDSVNIGGYLIVALFERWILTVAYFSNVFSDL